MTLKKILGCIAAAGLSVGGLILAGKSEFGKGLGEKPEENPDDLDLPCEDAAPEETETEPEPEAEE